MKIALFGATGGTGRQVLAQAIAQGYRVVALTRDPSKLCERDGLQVVVGDVLDQDAVDACVAGADAVICVIGSHGRGTPVEARGTQCILDAMLTSGVRRLIAVTSLGVGDSRRQLSWAVRLMMDVTLGSIMKAKEVQEAKIMASDLDWIIVRPGGLTDGPATQDYRHGVESVGKPGRISRADVADFVLRQLRDDTYLRRAPVVA